MALLVIPAEAAAVDGVRFTTPWSLWFASIFRAQPIHRTFTLDPASIPANTTALESVTVTGLTTDMTVSVTKDTHTSGLVISHAYVSAANTLAIVLGNVTTGAVSAGEETWRVTAWRR